MLNRQNILCNQDIKWKFGDKIETKEDVIQAKALWRHCLLVGYEEIYSGELKKLRQDINEFEKGNNEWR